MCFSNTGHHELPDDPAATEVLCKWNDPKPTKVESVPTNQLHFQQRTPLQPINENKRKRKQFENFNPVAPAKRNVNVDAYKALVLLQFLLSR